MNIEIPDNVLQTAPLSATDIKQEIAVLLLQKQVLNLEQATEIADMHPLEFEQLLVQRQIPAPLNFKKLSQLQKRDCIVGDPKELVHFDWAKEWNR
jgi:predicted HTH domain antitoxin